MMNKKKTKNTTAKVLNERGFVVGYLTSRHEEKGYDIELDAMGYTIVAI